MSSILDSENESLMSFGAQSPVSSYSTNRSSSSSPSPPPRKAPSLPSKTLTSKGQASSTKPSKSKKITRKTTQRIPPSTSKTYTAPKPPPTIPTIRLVVPPHDPTPNFLQRGPAPTVSHLAPLSIEPLDTVFPIQAPPVPRSPLPYTPQSTPPTTPTSPSSPLPNTPTSDRNEEHVFGDILASINQRRRLSNAMIKETLAEAVAVTERVTNVTNSAVEALDETMRRAIELEMELELEEYMDASLSAHFHRNTPSHQSSEEPQVQQPKKRWLLCAPANCIIE